MRDTRKEFAHLICECFENLLEEHGIEIPNEERTGAEGEACIYGTDYGTLFDQVYGFLALFQYEVSEIERRKT